jgi:hypothetical protein
MLTIKEKYLPVVFAELVLILPLGTDKTSLIPLPYDRLPNIRRQISSSHESNYIENGKKKVE